VTDFLPIDWTEQYPPPLDPARVPAHVAIVMDGNGRWANAQGLPRVEGHRAGEAALLDVVAGALQAGVTHLSVYAFSTENWNRSPEEVRFLMGFNRDVASAINSTTGVCASDGRGADPNCGRASSRI